MFYKIFYLKKYIHLYKETFNTNNNSIKRKTIQYKEKINYNLKLRRQHSFFTPFSKSCGLLLKKHLKI